MTKKKTTEGSPESALDKLKGIDRAEFCLVLIGMMQDAGREFTTFMVQWNMADADRKEMAERLNETMYMPSEVMALMVCILGEWSDNPDTDDFHALFMKALETKQLVNAEADQFFKDKEKADEH